MKKLNILNTIYSVIFSIMIVIAILCLTIMTIITSIKKEKFFKDNYNKLINTKIILDGEKTTIENKIIKEVIKEYNIKPGKIKDAINNPEVKKIISDLGTTSIEYIMGNKKLPKIDSKEVNKILNEYDINRYVTEKQTEEFVTNINQTLEKDLTDLSQNKNIRNSKELLSLNYDLLLPISIIISVIILLITTKSFMHTISYMGIDLIISSLLLGSILLMFKRFIYFDEINQIFELIIKNKLITYIIIYFLLGLALLGIRNLIIKSEESYIVDTSI